MTYEWFGGIQRECVLVRRVWVCGCCGWIRGKALFCLNAYGMVWRLHVPSGLPSGTQSDLHRYQIAPLNLAIASSISLKPADPEGTRVTKAF